MVLLQCLDNQTDIQGIYDLDFGNDDALLENSSIRPKSSAKAKKRSPQTGHQLKEYRVQFMSNISCKKNLTFNSEGIKLANDLTYL